MKMIRKVVIELSDDEKDILSKADEILVNVIDSLIDNKSNGHTPWQDGMIAPDCFWSICHHVNQIYDEELIP